MAQPSQEPATEACVKPEAAITVLSSWWWAVCRPKHVEQLRNNGIINSTTLLHLVGSFHEIYITMHGSMNIKFTHYTDLHLLAAGMQQGYIVTKLGEITKVNFKFVFIIQITISVNIHILLLWVFVERQVYRIKFEYFTIWRYCNIHIEAKFPLPLFAAILRNYS
jgi:hypothetical protein